MKVYIVSSVSDPYRLPLGVFDSLREVASFICVTLDHLKHCKCHPNFYCTKYFDVEGVVLDKD